MGEVGASWRSMGMFLEGNGCGFFRALGFLSIIAVMAVKINIKIFSENAVVSLSQ